MTFQVGFGTFLLTVMSDWDNSFSMGSALLPLVLIGHSIGLWKIWLLTPNHLPFWANFGPFLATPGPKLGLAKIKKLVQIGWVGCLKAGTTQEHTEPTILANHSSQTGFWPFLGVRGPKLGLAQISKLVQRCWVGCLKASATQELRGTNHFGRVQQSNRFLAILGHFWAISSGFWDFSPYCYVGLN